MKTSLTALENHDAFLKRHIGPSSQDEVSMLNFLGFKKKSELIDSVIPSKIRRKDQLPLGTYSSAKREDEALQLLNTIANKNKVFKSFIGQGYFNNLIPGVIQRNILENPAWYTAYTPYQPEISQGRLEAIVNFQQMLIDLTGMDIANASMLDEGTAAAEAMTLALRTCKSKSKVFFVGDDVLPQTLSVIKTRAKPLDIEVQVGPIENALTVDAFAVLIQYPGVNGSIQDKSVYTNIAEAVHARGGLVIAAADLLALTLICPPAEWGADVAIGSAQRFGVPLGFGGPSAGYLATKDELKRSMPGRLVGVTIDAQGQPAYRLALQTREQHIRREKATSNICTAQVLLAVMASMYAVYHGPTGLKNIALKTHRQTSIIALALKQLGYEIANQFWFDTLTIKTDKAAAIHEKARSLGCNLRGIDANHVGISFDETTNREELNLVWEIFGGQGNLDIDNLDQQVVNTIPNSLIRTSTYLTHPTFNRYHSEHEMLRYLRSLADKDLALDRTMIPLGSCTMKLNATSEMVPVTWPSFSQIHPLAPETQWAGYAQLIEDTERMMCAATGYDAVSLQPNAGSQGEYAGLLVIRAYHESRGEGHRNICLIPSSAHGTNPASAQMAGMQVIVVNCDKDGNVDLADLKNKAELHSKNLAAIMITYPSTHGVFEEGVQELCEIIHQHGGQVYIDGANMNALVGTAAPGHFGGDVSHLNLHKTFCIPHGGGGPGVGPVAVKAHLAKFLPCSYTAGTASKWNDLDWIRISASPFGSASILPISWMYVAMMGSKGLAEATETAILAANYVAKKLDVHYPVLYKGTNGLVAHECIIDLRPLQKDTGISNEDVAKRLMDFGFHAPTMSFPVPGTLMIEPTESESKFELDRFIEAMVAIAEEIKKVGSGIFDKEDNPLKNAPHTAEAILANEWNHSYTREEAAYPVARLRKAKYWPPVGRADNVYGDRNLFCTCAPVADYA
ncbi:aminomethyl-transferring glycine dehydrogenase [Polynucleobacter sp. MWH-Spelu-300-X4]|uniref:aminomethyl-transferring glycine dehydrogenase n=1 Tax=Polynucleobacter sp. MWH-Spelu-300-X4 TaxID=2689109 RepID=UPI001BFCE144|nr:aminomethyl-transferring glycine dehydrogenase [Polynucleobacter sp. MWH-Spelu-300-X4]QWD79781.1 aminomethyl-transferring glycine dehydrogenase [Polynucleobacter sp. MWH-Spelu-300-X4]